MSVTESMESIGFEKEARFCTFVQEWCEAEDEPGVSAAEKVKRRLRFRKFLLSGVNLGSFPPPPGGYICGMSQTMFEGLVQNIDTHIQLCAICRAGTYTQRAVISLVNETVFRELSELEPTKLGSPKAPGL